MQYSRSHYNHTHYVRDVDISIDLWYFMVTTINNIFIWPIKVRRINARMSRRGGFVRLELKPRVVFTRSDSRQLHGHGDWPIRFRGKHGPIEALGMTFSLFFLHPVFSLLEFLLS